MVSAIQSQYKVEFENYYSNHSKITNDKIFLIFCRFIDILLYHKSIRNNILESLSQIILFRRKNTMHLIYPCHT